MLKFTPIMPVYCSLPSYFSDNYAGKNSASQIYNIDKTENWGHFSTGVIIADVTADVTTHTPHMFK